MRAINLKTNHLTAPLGMDAGPLFLSWQCVDGVRQTAYEIELTANGEAVWHSGKVQSAAVHADAVLQHVGRLPCPYEQKRALLTAVLETVQST